MPYVRINYRSDWVGRKDIAVFYPGKAPNAGHKVTPWQNNGYTAMPVGAKYQVIWLLHGAGGDFSDWPLNSMIMRACEAAKVIVVMPTVQDFVSRHIELGDFYKCISMELPEFIWSIFPASPAREDNFIAGLSYGGYLAYRIALNNPEKYACVGSFASPLDVAADIREKHTGSIHYPKPEDIPGTDLDVLGLSAKLKAEGVEMPRMFQACGTEDFTWQYNQTAKAHFEQLGLDHTWFQCEGTHNFDFWDKAFKQYLDWLPLARDFVYPSKDIVIPRGGRFYAD